MTWREMTTGFATRVWVLLDMRKTSCHAVGRPCDLRRGRVWFAGIVNEGVQFQKLKQLQCKQVQVNFGAGYV